MSLANRILPAFIIALSFSTVIAAEPPLRMMEDGSAFIYRSQPGDLPASVATRFGIAEADVPAFLAANGIGDPTRVAIGHEYRIPNPMAVRAVTAEARVAGLEAELGAARAANRELEASAAAATARVADLEKRATSLERLERLWPWMELLGFVLLAGTVIAGWLAYRSVAKLADAEQYARTLADEVEQRRRAGLAERQQSARRVLDLEERVQVLERELAPHRSVSRRPTGTH